MKTCLHKLYYWLHPHRCRVFTEFPRIRIKKCDECGAEYWMSDGSRVPGTRF